jgi:hypothetical protein
MELESLKYIWHNLEAPPVSREAGPKTSPGAKRAVAPDREALLILMQKRSQGPVARMKRNLLYELILVIVTYIPTILFYWTNFDGRLSPIGWLMLLVMVLFAGYYYRKNRLLRRMQCVQCEVRSNLERQLKTLKQYVRFYLLAGTLMVPGILVLSWFIIRWKLPRARGADLIYRLQHPQWWAHPLSWLILLALFTIGSYYINTWYVNKLYGRHIKKLEGLLREMDEE